MDTFDLIKRDLPNFPDDVIRDWLLPYAEEIGWPPTHSRWRGILSQRPLPFWTSVTWSQQDLDLSTLPYSEPALEALNGLKDAVTSDQENEFARGIPNFKVRIKSALQYILEYGNFPRPISILRQNDEHDVVDGNHRMVGWYLSRIFVEQLKYDNANGLLEQREDMEKRLREKWGIKSVAPGSLIQRVWLAQ